MYDLRPHRQVHRCAASCPPCARLTRFVPAVRCTVPGGPNRPHRGAIPPVPPGPLYCPNCTQPTIPGLTVAAFQQVRPPPAHRCHEPSLACCAPLRPRCLCAGVRGLLRAGATGSECRQPHPRHTAAARATPRRAQSLLRAAQASRSPRSCPTWTSSRWSTTPSLTISQTTRSPHVSPLPPAPALPQAPRLPPDPRPLAAARRRARRAVSADRARARRRPPRPPFLGLHRLGRDQR